MQRINSTLRAHSLFLSHFVGDISWSCSLTSAGFFTCLIFCSLINPTAFAPCWSFSFLHLECLWPFLHNPNIWGILVSQTSRTDDVSACFISKQDMEENLLTKNLHQGSSSARPFEKKLAQIRCILHTPKERWCSEQFLGVADSTSPPALHALCCFCPQSSAVSVTGTQTAALQIQPGTQVTLNQENVSNKI